MADTDVQVSVHVFPSKDTGAGDQVIVGIVDRDGNAFTPKFFIFHGGYAAVNTLTCLPSASGNMLLSIGIDDGTDGTSFAASDDLEFDAKICNGGTGVRYSLMDANASVFFGGFISGYGYVSAIGVGTATITWDLKGRTGDDIMVVCIGGDALTVDVQAGFANGTYVTSGIPKGLLNGGTQAWASTPAATTPATVRGSWGWDTVAGNRAAFSAAAFNQSSNSRALLTDRCSVDVDIAGLIGGTPIVSVWDDDSYTVSGGGGTNVSMIAFGGVPTVCTAGVITQPLGVGIQTFNVDCDVRWLKIGSVGNVSDSGLVTDMAQYAIGWTDGTRQASFWTGETVSGNGTPLTGARYLSDETILRFGTPDASSTTFDAVAEFVSMTTDGTVTIDWTVNDGEPREIVWFALGTEASPPPPTPTSTTYARRWLRRFMLPFNENQRVFLSRIEFLMQTGVGLSTGQGSDPVVMMRLSKDGGFTWGHETQMSMGKIGEYFHRVYANRLGQGRQWVCEISGTDPVPVYLLDCWVDGDAGTN